MMGPTRDDAESSQDPREGGEERGRRRAGWLRWMRGRVMSKQGARLGVMVPVTELVKQKKRKIPKARQ